MQRHCVGLPLYIAGNDGRLWHSSYSQMPAARSMAPSTPPPGALRSGPIPPSPGLALFTITSHSIVVISRCNSITNDCSLFFTCEYIDSIDGAGWRDKRKRSLSHALNARRADHAKPLNPPMDLKSLCLAPVSRQPCLAGAGSSKPTILRAWSTTIRLCFQGCVRAPSHRIVSAIT